jgi:hypothetical protein
MWCIVTDERRRMAAKAARPEGVAGVGYATSVATSVLAYPRARREGSGNE